MSPYAVERWTDDEAEVLKRYVTNLDGPVFALVNLPEVVKGALFARYSRTSKSLRRLFLDEFVEDLDIDADDGIDATVGVSRAEALYERVFVEYGDDSVAQLGGVHLACEQASNLLTKVLEWGRLMSYLEQSTRYVPYDNRLAGRYRYHRDAAILESPHGARYVGDMDRLFETYTELLTRVTEWARGQWPRAPGDSDLVWRTSVRAKALDAVRGILPAGSLSNVGIYGSGQGYEALLLRMRASPLPEARQYAELILTELRKVVPSFLRRVDLPDRGGAWSEYLQRTREGVEAVAAELFPEPGRPSVGGDEVTLLDWDPLAEDRLLAAVLAPHTDRPESEVAERVGHLRQDERERILAAYVGERTNRRHKPGRALERAVYRFEIVSDYGAFRDLQRHRLLTVEWQPLTPRHGYVLPEAVVDAGGGPRFEEAMARSAALHDSLVERFPTSAAYAVSLAHRVRYTLTLNAREAMHVIELRTSPQGHPSYRRVCAEMHRLIAERAGHRAIASMMTFVDASEPGGELERLAAERRAEFRRAGT